jgi:hypothetical protein
MSDSSRMWRPSWPTNATAWPKNSGSDAAICFICLDFAPLLPSWPPSMFGRGCPPASEKQRYSTEPQPWADFRATGPPYLRSPHKAVIGVARWYKTSRSAVATSRPAHYRPSDHEAVYFGHARKTRPFQRLNV